MHVWRRRLLLTLAVPAIAGAACRYLPPPTATSASGRPLDGAPPRQPPTAAPSTPAFAPFWVKNHRLTGMWSGPPDAPGVVSFGATSAQFCSFLVARQPDGPRLYVLNPYSADYFWIDADAVGPVAGPPERRPQPKPHGQNCSETIYEG